MFALSPDFQCVLLLKKPATHRNPLFRDRWTAPGGHLENGETELNCALREMEEETQLLVSADEARFILRFSCDCDPLESEHDVTVYGAVLSYKRLEKAKGTPVEPIGIFGATPPNIVWHVPHLLQLTIGRMRQAVSTSEGAR